MNLAPGGSFYRRTKKNHCISLPFPVGVPPLPLWRTRRRRGRRGGRRLLHDGRRRQRLRPTADGQQRHGNVRKGRTAAAATTVAPKLDIGRIRLFIRRPIPLLEIGSRPVIPRPHPLSVCTVP